MYQVDEMWMNIKDIVEKSDDLKGLRNFLTIPTKVKFEDAGMVLRGNKMLIPSFNIYTNEVRLNTIPENGPTHKLYKTLNICTRTKTFTERNLSTLGQELFNNMMIDGFNFYDNTNKIEVSADFQCYDKAYIIGTVKYFDDKFVSYRAYPCIDFLIAVWKYHPDRFKEFIFSEDSKDLFELISGDKTSED